MSKIKIALWNYGERFDITGIAIKQIAWTGSTVKFILTNDRTVYGVYPDLPKVDSEIKDDLFNRFGFTPANILLDCWDKITVTSLYNGGHSQVFSAYITVPDQGDVKPTTTLKFPDGFTAKLTAATDQLVSLSDATATLSDCLTDHYVANHSSSAVHLDGDVYIKGRHIDDYIKNINNEEERKETTTMNMFGNIRTGEAGPKYAITYFGSIAFSGKTYHNGTIYEAQGMTFPCKMLYLVPATSVAKGDIIEKDGYAYHITNVNSAGTIEAINLVSGKEETIVPGGPFGVSIYSKLFNPFGDMKGENAFGNMMLMQAMMGSGNGGAGDAMMMAMLMSQGGFKLPTFNLPTAPKAENKEG